MNKIHIRASKEYDVLIGRGLFDELGSHAARVLRGRNVVVVSDSNVAPLYLGRAVKMLKEAGFTVGSFSFPAGEENKNGNTYLTLLNFLAEKRLTRADALIALGGGVVGDLTGFTAATFLRGIACIQVPTTLLACVDSSVGGKTAIDLPAGKNLAGAFYQPDLVICDPNLIETLPENVFSDGCAEVIKYGMLGSGELLERLQARHAKDDLEYVIAKCVDMKREVVEGDEFDTGRRQLLNLGHTLGHAVEANSDFTISHGQAVAIGMAMIAEAAVNHGLCTEETRDEIVSLLRQYGLPTGTAQSPEQILATALGDKKRRSDTLTLIVPREVGRCDLYPVPVEELRDWIQASVD